MRFSAALSSIALGALGCTNAGRAARGVPDTNPPALECIETVAMGGNHTCVLFRNGRVQCFGSVLSAGNGRYSGPDRHRRPVATSARFSSLRAGYAETCGVERDGSVWCWGERSGMPQGPYAVPTRIDGFLRNNVDVGIGIGQVCALKRDESVWCWNWNDPPSKVLVGARRLHVSGYVACAEMNDGRAFCWGLNDCGQLGRGTRTIDDWNPKPEGPGPVIGSENFTTLRVSGTGACALTRTRELWCWGNGDRSFFMDGRWWRGGRDEPAICEPRPRRLEVGVPIRDMVVTGARACVIAEDGSVWCWGSASYGEMLGTPAIVETIDGVEVGIEPRPRRLDELGTDNLRIFSGAALCVQKLDRTLVCWGSNVSEEAAPGSNASRVGLSRLPVECPPD